jgi:hypothetical protein
VKLLFALNWSSRRFYATAQRDDQAGGQKRDSLNLSANVVTITACSSAPDETMIRPLYLLRPAKSPLADPSAPVEGGGNAP